MRRRDVAADPATPVFEEIVVPCGSREEAQAEAERQQAGDAPEATWIYLRVGEQWIAKRTPTHLPEPPRSLGGTLIDVIIPW